MAVKEQTTIMPKSIPSKVSAQTPASLVPEGQALQTDSFNTLNATVQSLRSQNKVPEAIRQLAAFDGTTSSAIFDFVEVAHSPYTVAAYDPVTHVYNPQATALTQAFISRMNNLYDYTQGYSDRLSLDTLIEMGLLEVVVTGAVCQELVLDKARLPDSINIFSYDSIIWKNKKGSRYPVQLGTTGEIPLDYPTIFVTESHRFAKRSTARSMMEPAISSSWYFNEFVEDMRRTLRSQGNSRLVVTLTSEKVMASATPEIKADPQRLADYFLSVRQQVEEVVKGLSPEDALVMYDTAEASALKMLGEKSDYVPLLQNLSGALATSLKTHPSILGLRMEGSQSLSNTESLIFLKVARAIQKPVETNLSRILTLSCRLYGIDAYVEFRFEPINLRPEDELEAFKVMKQTRIIEQLSLGFITDDQAALELGRWSRPPGSPNLSGTGFQKSTTVDAGKASPNADPQGRALQPTTPPAGGGGSK